jgi:adenosylmethionine-8-amino-7-oxononanoate aminotransferase
LIFDEIATGFGRTGELFAYRHADVTPDILCLGKALTGGTMTMAAVLTTRQVARGVEAGGRVLMHGPTFMANPLACAAAEASLALLDEEPWQERVRNLQTWLTAGLEGCMRHLAVKEVRVLGAIAAVELDRHVDLPRASASFVERGVWIRPFMNLIYVMPPYITTESQTAQLCEAIERTIAEGRF